MSIRYGRIIIMAALFAAAQFVLHDTQAGTAPGGAGFQDVLDLPAGASPMAAKTLYNGIVVAGSRLVAVGQRGHIVYSDDQGTTWVQARVPVSADLTAVCFATPKKGWAVGHDGVVLNSTDSGATWNKQLDGRSLTRIVTDYYAAHPPAGPAAAMIAEDVRQAGQKGADKPLLDVLFENETTGYVVGAFNLILRTTDGGRNWEPLLDRTDNPKRFHLYAIRRVAGELFIGGEQGLMLRLNSTTGRFQALSVPYNGSFFGVTGTQSVVIAYGLRGTVYRSTDKGKSWHRIDTGIPIGLTGASVLPDNRIALVNQAGQVLVSADNGEHFSPVKAEQPFPAASVVALDKENVMLAGMRGMLKLPLK